MRHGLVSSSLGSQFVKWDFKNTEETTNYSYLFKEKDSSESEPELF